VSLYQKQSWYGLTKGIISEESCLWREDGEFGDVRALMSDKSFKGSLKVYGQY